MSASRQIRIRQIRSGIGRPAKQKRILAALGLGRMHRVVVKPDNPAVRGMVAAIPHLVEIVDESEQQAR
ncbi:MAG: 50S ribosomal protein L30 [Acidobacteriota bacterium]|nr:MAG: 50S ribosomal protein L30 [Acidobacteriota bacterium]